MRIDAETTAKLTVQRSRFFAVLFPASGEGDVKKVLDGRRRWIKKARHHCWALRYTNDAGQLIEVARDDGEVGKPGHKILGVLRRHDIEGGLIVSRVFGGVKLGPAGVGRAFREVALEAAETATQVR